MRRKELRAAPPVWLMEMLRGEPKPKHQLAKMLNFHFFRANGSQLSHVFNHPHLRQVHTIIIGYRNSVSKSMFEAMVTSPVMHTVKHLYIEKESAKCVDYFVDMLNTHKDDTTMSGLEHLYTPCPQRYKDVEVLKNVTKHRQSYY